jgi:hypothetical protein
MYIALCEMYKSHEMFSLEINIIVEALSKIDFIFDVEYFR